MTAGTALAPMTHPARVNCLWVNAELRYATEKRDYVNPQSPATNHHATTKTPVPALIVAPRGNVNRNRGANAPMTSTVSRITMMAIHATGTITATNLNILGFVGICPVPKSTAHRFSKIPVWKISVNRTRANAI